MTRVYLDTSAYNRPFDDQTQPKLFLETQAVVIILQMVEVIPVLYEDAQNVGWVEQRETQQRLGSVGFR